MFHAIPRYWSFGLNSLVLYLFSNKGGKCKYFFIVCIGGMVCIYVDI